MLKSAKCITICLQFVISWWCHDVINYCTFMLLSLFRCLAWFVCAFSFSSMTRAHQGRKKTKKRTKTKTSFCFCFSPGSVCAGVFSDFGQLLAFGSLPNCSIFGTLTWLTLLRRKHSCRIMKMDSLSGLTGWLNVSVNDWLAERMKDWLIDWIAKSLTHWPTVCWLAD